MPARPTLGALLAVSVALHGLAGAGLWLGWTNTQADTPREAASLRIALGSRGAAAGGQPVDDDTPAPDTEPDTLPPRPEPEPEHEPEREPVRLAETQPRPAPQPARQEPPAPAPMALPAPVPVHTPQTAATAGSAGISGSDDRTDTPQTSQADDAPGFTGAMQYDGLVLAALERAKRYPAMARQRGETGHVGVVFEIDRQGHVLDAAVTASSGSRRLDRAALAQIERADPFPPAPDAAPWHTRRFATDIRFSLGG